MEMKAFFFFGAAAALFASACGQPLPALNVGSVTTGGVSAGAFMAVQVHIAFSSVRSHVRVVLLNPLLRAAAVCKRLEQLVRHCQVVKGTSVIAGGPWYCAQNSITTAVRAPAIAVFNNRDLFSSPLVRRSSLACTRRCPQAPVALLLTRSSPLTSAILTVRAIGARCARWRGEGGSLACARLLFFFVELGNVTGAKVWVYSGMIDSVVKTVVVKAAETFYETLGANVTSEYGIISEVRERGGRVWQLVRWGGQGG